MKLEEMDPISRRIYLAKLEKKQNELDAQHRKLKKVGKTSKGVTVYSSPDKLVKTETPGMQVHRLVILVVVNIVEILRFEFGTCDFGSCELSYFLNSVLEFATRVEKLNTSMHLFVLLSTSLYSFLLLFCTFRSNIRTQLRTQLDSQALAQSHAQAYAAAVASHALSSNPLKPTYETMSRKDITLAKSVDPLMPFPTLTRNRSLHGRPLPLIEVSVVI